MKTENLSTLKIHKLTQEQYDREYAANRIDQTALYLTPDNGCSSENFSGILPIKKGGTGNKTGYITTGQTTEASVGEYATAEGRFTSAHRNYSHAEGYRTQAEGFCSHAEGRMDKQYQPIKFEYVYIRRENLDNDNELIFDFTSSADNINLLSELLYKIDNYGFIQVLNWADDHDFGNFLTNSEIFELKEVAIKEEGILKIISGLTEPGNGTGTTVIFIPKAAGAFGTSSHFEGANEKKQYECFGGSFNQEKPYEIKAYLFINNPFNDFDVNDIESVEILYAGNEYVYEDGNLVPIYREYHKKYKITQATLLPETTDREYHILITTKEPITNSDDEYIRTDNWRLNMKSKCMGAIGNSSHREGYNTLSYGDYSHAEGYATYAKGKSSHAEGFNTYINADAAHVQGKHNIHDNENIYAHIIGNGYVNGDGQLIKSNAHTIDWNGNAWYSGDVYVGSISGTNKDNGSKKLATEEYVKNVEFSQLILKSSTQGSNKKFKITIDDSGTLNATEIIDGDMLIDFEYKDNNNGTYTITDWKGTLDGVNSNKLIIPDSSSIIL